MIEKRWRWSVAGGMLLIMSACGSWDGTSWTCGGAPKAPSARDGGGDAAVAASDAGSALSAQECPEPPECTLRTVIDAKMEEPAEGPMRSEVLCQLALDELVPSLPWTEAQDEAWLAQCKSLMLFEPPRVPEPAAEPEIEPCQGLDDLKTQRDAMVARTLADDAWLAYGKTLAACRPEQKPWKTLDLAGGETQFKDWYVFSFLNGDVLRGGLFRSRETRAYSRVFRVWVGEQ